MYIISSDTISANEFILVLPFLPALESMNIPAIPDQDLAAEVADCIANNCPKLRSLDKSDICYDAEGVMALELLEALEENTLESFSFLQYKETWDTMDVGLRGHFGSLKSVVFNECIKISINTVMVILLGCTQLEVFKINPNFPTYEDNFRLPLHKLARRPWASNKFKELQLVVTLDDAFVQQPADFNPKDIRSGWEDGYERFYCQIGSLTQLRVLDLMVCVESERRRSDGRVMLYYDLSFPGMMVLQDEATGRKGWLQLLTGLENLEMLCGSPSVESMLPGFGFGQREAEWVADHWPKLKNIEFYSALFKSSSSELSSPIQHLKEKRPELEVVVNH
ncbi:hypothetical protein BGX29_009194 [Mortierella sp. GBA35]|nr:hypothetical protein BGX29_009194 [Mortierella sp. GBA35]